MRAALISPGAMERRNSTLNLARFTPRLKVYRYEPHYFSDGRNQTEDMKKIRTYSTSALNELDEKVKIIVNNEVPIAVLELSETTDKSGASLTYASIGVGSECSLSGNLVLFQGGSPSKISWNIGDPQFSFSFPDISDLQKALFRKSFYALKHKHLHARKSKKLDAKTEALSFKP